MAFYSRGDQCTLKIDGACKHKELDLQMMRMNGIMKCNTQSVSQVFIGNGQMNMKHFDAVATIDVIARNCSTL